MDLLLTRKEASEMLRTIDDDLNAVQQHLTELRELKTKLDDLIVSNYHNPAIINEYVTSTMKNGTDEFVEHKDKIASALNEATSILKATMFIMNKSEVF